MIICAPLDTFCLYLLSSKIRHALFPPDQSKPSWPRAGALAIGEGVLMFPTLLLFGYLFAHGQWLALNVFVIAGVCMAWPFLAIGSALVFERDHRRYEEWGSLEIG